MQRHRAEGYYVYCRRGRRRSQSTSFGRRVHEAGLDCLNACATQGERRRNPIPASRHMRTLVDHF
eukprot:4365724-Prymnesium_polylepis.1